MKKNETIPLSLIASQIKIMEEKEQPKVAIMGGMISLMIFPRGKSHAVCGAHLLRELTGVEDTYPDHSWAKEFKKPSVKCGIGLFSFQSFDFLVEVGNNKCQ